MSFTWLLPATCELCGHWIPKHDENCPRNGVHPSQWSSSHSDVAYHDRVDAVNPDYFKYRRSLHENGDQSTLYIYHDSHTLLPYFRNV